VLAAVVRVVRAAIGGGAHAGRTSEGALALSEVVIVLLAVVGAL